MGRPPPGHIAIASYSGGGENPDVTDLVNPQPPAPRPGQLESHEFSRLDAAMARIEAHGLIRPTHRVAGAGLNFHSDIAMKDEEVISPSTRQCNNTPRLCPQML